jgi:DNA-binding response OmpR family regulator
VTPVVLVHGGDAPPADGVAAGLLRDGFAVAELGAPLPPAPSAPLVLAWLAAGTDGAVLERLVRWRRHADGPCALIGCAPAGTGEDSERALAAGFDDFVAGRRSVRELAGRLRALARRLYPPEQAQRMVLGRLALDTPSLDAWIDGRRLRLTPLEARTLEALVRAPGHTLTRTQLLEHVWGRETSARAVDNLVQRLRRKIGEDSLVAIRRIGFRLDV